jgi:hypothetical protein
MTQQPDSIPRQGRLPAGECSLCASAAGKTGAAARNRRVLVA